MLQTLAKWFVSFVSMAREIQENRDALRHLQTRVRDLEEMLKLSVQEARHAREMEKVEREKLLLQLERAVSAKALPEAQKRQRKSKP